MEAGDRAIMSVLARLTIAAVCPVGMPAVMGSWGARAMSMPNTATHVKMQIPRVMYVT
jgi:hypothetical protein